MSHASSNKRPLEMSTAEHSGPCEPAVQRNVMPRTVALFGGAGKTWPVFVLDDDRFRGTVADKLHPPVDDDSFAVLSRPDLNHRPGLCSGQGIRNLRIIPCSPSIDDQAGNRSLRLLRGSTFDLRRRSLGNTGPCPGGDSWPGGASGSASLSSQRGSSRPVRYAAVLLCLLSAADAFLLQPDVCEPARLWLQGSLLP